MNEINGLPVHVLVVHAVVVLIPLTALVLVLCAFWPAARTRLMWPLLVLAVVTMGLVPVATNAGEWLMRQIDITPLAAKHIALGDTLAPWVVGLFLLAVAVTALGWFRPQALTAWWDRTDSTTDAAPSRTTWDTVARFAVPVVVLLVALGAVVQVYRVGDSGARAVWEDKVSSTSAR